MGQVEKQNVSKNPMKWQLYKAETNHGLPEVIIKEQHNVQGVFVLKFRAGTTAGPYQKCQITC